MVTAVAEAIARSVAAVAASPTVVATAVPLRVLLAVTVALSPTERTSDTKPAELFVLVVAVAASAVEVAVAVTHAKMAKVEKPKARTPRLPLAECPNKVIYLRIPPFPKKKLSHTHTQKITELHL